MKQFFCNHKITYVGITFLLALYFATVVNIPLYSELYDIFSKLEAVKIGFVLSIPIFFLCAFNFLFNLFSWPWLTKPFFAILILLSTAVSYAAFNYGTLFDADMIVNIVETDTSEASSYLSVYSTVWIVLMGILPMILLILLPIEKATPFLQFLWKKLLAMVGSLIVILLIAFFYYQDYSSVGRNNSYLKQLIIPTQFIYGIGKYVNRTYLSTPIPYTKIALDAKQMKAVIDDQVKPTLMIFILGETARSKNYELNGYQRHTNKYTKALDVISFQNVSSCGTATSVSVPCMFSMLSKDEYSRKKAENQDNWLDVMKRAGIDLLWLENDGGDKSVAKNIHKIEVDRHRMDDMCNGKTCFDMAMLEHFDEYVKNMKGNRMLLMHLNGSHGPTYFQRYPEKMKEFKPDCPRADIENCNVEQIINSYDNTILYTDFVIAQTIKKLQSLNNQYNTALFYISDHGESLGENGIFLHGIPYRFAPEEQTKIPMMVWMSEDFAKEKGIDQTCLKKYAKEGAYTHDNLFNSMLGIMDIQTTTYRPAMDLFSECRNQRS